jgi:hypothetical protein
MERRVKARYLRDPRKHLSRSLDQLNRLRKVQWREVYCGLQLFQNGARDHLMMQKVGAAMHNPVADDRRRTIDIVTTDLYQSKECLFLRFEKAAIFVKRATLRVKHAKATIAAPNAIDGAGQ